MEDKIINKVAKSSIININLETFYPKGARVLFDIKALLYEGLILKEKDFRAFIKNEDWSAYQDKYVGIHAISSTLNSFCKKSGFRRFRNT
jgi:hypothetical protein